MVVKKSLFPFSRIFLLLILSSLLWGEEQINSESPKDDPLGGSRENQEELLFDLSDQNSLRTLSASNKEFIPSTSESDDRVSAVSNSWIEERIPEIESVLKKPIEGWGSLKLGLTFDEVNMVLSNEYPWMILRPVNPEVSPERIYFLETFKNDFFTKIQFQFDDQHSLYLLRLEMNPRYFSFPKLYNRLFEDYGSPQENSYIRVIWRDGSRSLELYRNNTVIYVDKENWETLPGSIIEDQRQKLLDSVFDNL